MSYDARAIANWFLDHAESVGESLTQMKLQKLVYISHGWNLALCEEPLVHDAIEAWKWGPVIRSLYREFSEFGSSPITKKAQVLDGSSLENLEISIDQYGCGSPEYTKGLLERIWSVYGRHSAAQLSDMTHRPGTPWHTMWERMGNRILPYTVIPNELIRDHYLQLSNGQRAAAAV